MRNIIKSFGYSNAHLILKAVGLTYDQPTSIDCALKLRNCFFSDAENIGQLTTLNERITSYDLDALLVNKFINDGSAMVALMVD
ncbi:hypothetical protein [Psychromonas hadalis]|uniref:hypothetical protein n=1 Tax=Psychromonas hadalis TaxID=211669 RepID=UPI0003B39590|nr:hypothetical protein [Psychromonas hadalis]